MDLYLLRHGLAVDAGAPGAGSDFDRPLTPEGLERTRRAARGMQKIGVSVDLVLSSTASRAVQTAEIAAKAIGNPLIKKAEFLYEGNSHEIRKRLADYAEVRSMLVVGHAPTLGELASLLLSGEPNLDIQHGKAGLIRMEVSLSQEQGKGRLRWLLQPEILEALGKDDG